MRYCPAQVLYCQILLPLKYCPCAGLELGPKLDRTVATLALTFFWSYCHDSSAV